MISHTYKYNDILCFGIKLALGILAVLCGWAKLGATVQGDEIKTITVSIDIPLTHMNKFERYGSRLEQKAKEGIHSGNDYLLEDALVSKLDPNHKIPLFSEAGEQLGIMTLLEYASFLNKISAAKILLKWNADPNDHQHTTPPIVFFMNKDNVEMMEVFYQHGARLDFNAWRHGVETSFFYNVCMLNETSEAMILWFLSKGFDVNEQQVFNDEMKNIRFSMTPFTWAIKNGRVGTIQAFIDEGANLSDYILTGTDAYTFIHPLEHAAMGHEEILRILLENGSDPNATCALMMEEEDGTMIQQWKTISPLSTAIEGEHWQCANMLWSYGALPHTDEEWQLLIEAAVYRNVDIDVKTLWKLYEAKEYEDSREEKLANCLLSAAQAEREDLVLYFLGLDADPAHVIKRNGLNAYQSTLRSGHPEMAKILEALGGEGNAIDALFTLFYDYKQRIQDRPFETALPAACALASFAGSYSLAGSYLPSWAEEAVNMGSSEIVTAALAPDPNAQLKNKLEALKAAVGSSKKALDATNSVLRSTTRTVPLNEFLGMSASEVKSTIKASIRKLLDQSGNAAKTQLINVKPRNWTAFKSWAQGFFGKDLDTVYTTIIGDHQHGELLLTQTLKEKTYKVLAEALGEKGAILNIRLPAASIPNDWENPAWNLASIAAQNAKQNWKHAKNAAQITSTQLQSAVQKTRAQQAAAQQRQTTINAELARKRAEAQASAPDSWARMMARTSIGLGGAWAAYTSCEYLGHKLDTWLFGEDIKHELSPIDKVLIEYLKHQNEELL